MGTDAAINADVYADAHVATSIVTNSKGLICTNSVAHSVAKTNSSLGADTDIGQRSSVLHGDDGVIAWLVKPVFPKRFIVHRIRQLMVAHWLRQFPQVLPRRWCRLSGVRLRHNRHHRRLMWGNELVGMATSTRSSSS